MSNPAVHEPERCQCLNVGDALRLAFAGVDRPECPAHDQTSATTGGAIALNDDASLKAVIGRALAGDTTSTTYKEEFHS